MIATTALVVIDTTIVAIGLSDLRADFGVAGVESVVVSYLVTMGALTQIAGSLSDRIGRRRLFLAGIAVFTAASLAAAAAPSLLLLDLARALQGVGAAVLMVNALPLLSHRYEGEARNLAIAAWGSVATASGLIAPLLGGLLIDTFGWRAMFAVNVPIGVAALAFGWRRLPYDTPAVHPAGVDWLGGAMLALGLGSGTLALLRGDEQGWTAPATALLIAISLVALAAFLLTERRAAAPMLELRLFAQRAFTGALAAVFISRVLTIGGTVYFVVYFQDSLGLTASQAGLLMTPVFLAQMATGMVGAKLLSWWAPGIVIASGYVLKGAAALALAMLVAPDAPIWALIVALLVWGAGGGIAGSPVMAVAMNVTAPERAGMVAGAVTSLAAIGAGVGTAALGAIFRSRVDAQETDGTRQAVADGASAVLFTSAALAAVTVVLVLILIDPRRVPRPKPDASAEAEPARTGDRTAPADDVRA
ncbi:MFS transporter [Nocardia sp. NPDC059180]|uniref:MFS transporter n=1 Tax=Nocardia sp. NPDC059180 TaxID=3346761 RepID=UPI003694F16F